MTHEGKVIISIDLASPGSKDKSVMFVSGDGVPFQFFEITGDVRRIFYRGQLIWNWSGE